MDKNKGITLIVLIITVILLIILAGVTINFVGEGKIFNSAGDVVNRSEEQMNDHEQMVNDVRNMIIGDASEPGKDDSEEENPVCTTHIPGEWIIIDAATCTTTGTKVKKCTVCDTILETSIIAATGHSYGSWETTQAATCTVTGTQTRTCTKCGNTETQTIAATGHSYGGWETTQAATCTTAGTKVKKCTVCGTILETSTITALGHNYVDGVCTRCGDTKLISFTLYFMDMGGYTMSFTAPEGYTWNDFVNSSYNQDGMFSIVRQSGVEFNGGGYILNVSASSTIENGSTYFCTYN